MLILDPSSNDAEQTINILRNNGHAVRATQIITEDDLELALEKQSWDLFIARDNMTAPSAEQCLKIVQHYGRDISFIMTTPDYSVKRTVEAIQLGMKDVVPADNDEYFKLVVERELLNIEDRRTMKLADKALRETDKRNELLLDSSRDAIAYVIDGMHIYVNHAYMELFGYEDPDDLECMPIMDLMPPSHHEQFKSYIKSHSKGEVLEDFSFVGLKANNDNFEAFLSMTDSEYDGENCTQIYIKTSEASDEELAKKLKELSAQDRLTGLSNQEHFLEAVTESIGKASHDNQLAAVLYLDLDNFNHIQDEHGRSNGDLYLKEVSQWLTDKLPPNSLLARIGDSTFSVLVNITKPKEAQELATELYSQFAENLFEISNLTITDTLSIGISPVQETSTNAEKVLSNSHFAASSIQTKGGNGCRMHDNDLDSLESREDAQTDIEIQDAWDTDKIHVKYEPIVKLHGSLEKMFHARLTVDTEQGQTKGIKEVYDVGLRTSTARKLDHWLMNDAFPVFVEYLKDNTDSKLKIKLSAASLLDDDLVPSVLKLLSENNLPIESIIFEFQEDDTVAYLKRAIQVIKSMGKEGLTTALSGFGRTLDSQAVINAINHEGFSWVSIDISLLDNFMASHEMQEKVQELLTFAKANSLITIAPMINDPGMLATIWPMDVDHIHGEYIGVENDNLTFDFSEASF
ncbi:MAG: diguanylate cyclase (GGDEF)-like protein/PAS domain S-box-containing protein [Enterobacterales bacterium]|jgi:diguanylate cyclase (GGDEF)-like protein/PAS domain S-box-containing protein